VTKKLCVECGDHVPVYQNFFCESCWKKVLRAKLEAEDADETIESVS
jgi:rRNA maturation endonuclease Nob1